MIFIYQLFNKLKHDHRFTVLILSLDKTDISIIFTNRNKFLFISVNIIPAEASNIDVCGSLTKSDETTASSVYSIIPFNSFSVALLTVAHISSYVAGFSRLQVKSTTETSTVGTLNDIPVNYFYSSEDYGKCVGQYLNIKNVLVDKERVNYPISARMIRNNLERYKSFLDVNICNELINQEF